MEEAGQFDKAISFLDDVIKQSPDYVNAYTFLAKAYQEEDNPEEALFAAQTGLGYNELDEELYLIGAKAAAKLGKAEDAEDLLQRGLEVNPDNSSLRLLLSDLYLAQGRAEDSLALFTALADSDLEPQAHWNMARSYQEMEKYDQALQEYLLAYQSLQTSPAFLRGMISFAQESAQGDLDRQLLEKYLKLVPDDQEMQDLYEQLRN